MSLKIDFKCVFETKKLNKIVFTSIKLNPIYADITKNTDYYFFLSIMPNSFIANRKR